MSSSMHSVYIVEILAIRGIGILLVLVCAFCLSALFFFFWFVTFLNCYNWPQPIMKQFQYVGLYSLHECKASNEIIEIAALSYVSKINVSTMNARQKIFFLSYPKGSYLLTKKIHIFTDRDKAFLLWPKNGKDVLYCRHPFFFIGQIECYNKLSVTALPGLLCLPGESVFFVPKVNQTLPICCVDFFFGVIRALAKGAFGIGQQYGMRTGWLVKC